MKSALRDRLKLGTVDPVTGESDGVDALPELVTYAITRLEDLRKARDTLFEKKLRKYAAIAASNFDHRISRDPENRDRDKDSVFERGGNFSLQLIRSVKGFLRARLDKDVFGSRPWLSVSPRGTRNQPLAEQMGQHGEYKLLEARWRERGREAIDLAGDLGFAICKTRWREDFDASERMESVLTHPESGPVVTEAGDYLMADDDTQEAPMPQPGADGAQPPESPMAPPTADSSDEESGEQPGATDEAEPPRVFAKDPSIPAPHPSNNLAFKAHLIEDVERLYAGLEMSPLHWQDVAWPPNADALSLDCPACDFIGVTTSMTVEQIAASYDPEGDDEDMKELLAQLRSEATNPKSEATKPKLEMGETEVRGSDINNPSIKVTECYFRRRVLPTGPESRICLVLIESMQKAAFVSYLSALSPRSQAPVHMIAINQVPGRAYGRGWFEFFEMAADALDALMNGIIWRNEYHAKPANFIDNKAAADFLDNPIQHGQDKWNKLDGKGQPLSALFHQLVHPGLDENTWKMVELFMQLIQTESGVTNASQGDMTDLPSNSTATGVNSMLESSSVIHVFILETLKSGLTPAVRYALELLYFRQDEDEAYDALDGDVSASQAVEQAEGVAQAGPQQGAPTQPGVMTYAQAQKLRNLPLNVEILLSRAKRQELREAALASIPQLRQFLADPPQFQKWERPLLLQALRGFEINNPENCMPSAADIEATIQAAQNAPPDNSDTRVSLREQMAYKDAPPSIRRQMEQAAGFTPATDEEHASEAKAYVEKPGVEAPAPDKPADAPAPDTAPPDLAAA